jgi:hypothetical protein
MAVIDTASTRNARSHPRHTYPRSRPGQANPPQSRRCHSGRVTRPALHQECSVAAQATSTTLRQGFWSVTFDQPNDVGHADYTGTKMKLRRSRRRNRRCSRSWSTIRRIRPSPTFRDPQSTIPPPNRDRQDRRRPSVNHPAHRRSFCKYPQHS